MVSSAVIVVWLLLPAQQDLGYITLLVPYICHSPLLKGYIFVMCWQWSHHLTPLLVLDKRIVSFHVRQSTFIVHVTCSSNFYYCTTTVYWRVSKENGNWFFWWNFTSINKTFICFGYIITQRLLRLWWIFCILGDCALNENQHLVVSKSNKASIPKWLRVKMARVGYWW